MSNPVDESPVVAAECERIRLLVAGLLAEEGGDPVRLKARLSGWVDFNAPAAGAASGTPQEADGA